MNRTFDRLRHDFLAGRLDHTTYFHALKEQSRREQARPDEINKELLHTAKHGYAHDLIPYEDFADVAVAHQPGLDWSLGRRPDDELTIVVTPTLDLLTLWYAADVVATDTDKFGTMIDLSPCFGLATWRGRDPLTTIDVTIRDHQLTTSARIESPYTAWDARFRTLLGEPSHAHEENQRTYRTYAIDPQTALKQLLKRPQ